MGLQDYLTSGKLKANPTLAAGDAQVSIDGGAFANLTTLPAVTPALGRGVKISLSASEMNGDNITVVLSDQTSPPEWCDVILNIQTSASQIDDLALATSTTASAIRAAVGLASANLDTQLSAIAGYIDTEVASLVSAIIIRSNTAQAGAATTITLDASASATNDTYKGQMIVLTGGTGAGQSRLITAYNGTTKVATVAPAWATNPAAATTFTIVAEPGADIQAISGAAVDASLAQLGVNVVNWKDSAAAAMTGDAYARLGAPAGASVSVDIAAIKSDTASAVTQTTAASIRSVVGLASANLDTQLAAIAGYIDTEIGTLQTTATAIKAKTDNLPAAPAATSDIPTATENADALLDRADGVETGLTPRQAFRLVSAVLFGKVSGGGTGTEVFRDFGDTKARITATVDSSGNRTAITRDAT